MPYCKNCDEEISERQLDNFNQICPKCSRIEIEKRNGSIIWMIVFASIVILAGFFVLVLSISGISSDTDLDFLIGGIGLAFSIPSGCLLCVLLGELLPEVNEELKKLDNF